VVDLRDLELAYITEDAKGIHIGAMSTLQTMGDSPLLKELATGILARAAIASSFSRLIRNSATLGGTLAVGVLSQSDLLTVLAVLDAEVVLRSGSKSQVNLSGGTADRPGLPLSGVTFKGKQERRVSCRSVAMERKPNELIIEVIVPRFAYSCAASFMRVGRTPTDVALMNASAFVEVNEGVYKQVRLALGGVNMEPVRIGAVEKLLEGRTVATSGEQNTAVDTQQIIAAIQAGMADFSPAEDFRASAAYRKVSGMNLAFRVLEEAATISRWRNMISSKGRQ
jgi:CO/xanthine dehydrogenase FAD-binding subunit